MKIVPSDIFEAQLDEITDFIALDSEERADKFDYDLRDKLQTLDFMPYKYRQSIFFNTEHIRDLVFKGYVVPYLIDEKADEIVVLGICKENLLKI